MNKRIAGLCAAALLAAAPLTDAQSLYQKGRKNYTSLVADNRAMKLGDIVTIGDISGKVSRIRTRATTLLDFDNKEVVLGLDLDGSRKAYPFGELAKTEGVIADKLAGRDIRVSYDAQHRTARVLDGNGKELPSVMTYWFAWYAFYPESAVFYAK